jgi:hypothetical protein
VWDEPKRLANIAKHDGLDIARPASRKERKLLDG